MYGTNRAVYPTVNQRQYRVQDPVQQYVSSKPTHFAVAIRPADFRLPVFRGLITSGLQRSQNQEIETFDDEPESTTDISENETSSMLARYFGILLSLFSNVLLSGSFMSAVCAFAPPICTLSFLLSFLRSNQGDQEQSSDEYINSNDIEILKAAFEKYRQMQTNQRAQ